MVVKVGFEKSGVEAEACRGFADVDGLLEPRQAEVLVGLLSGRRSEADWCDRSRISRGKARLVTRCRRVMQRRRTIGIIKHRPWLMNRQTVAGVLLSCSGGVRYPDEGPRTCSVIHDRLPMSRWVGSVEEGAAVTRGR